MIRHNALRDPMVLHTLSKEQVSYMGCIINFMQDIKWAILENLSTITKIESLPFLELRKPKTKSMEVFTQGALVTSKGVYNPCSMTLDLACLHEMHLACNLSTSWKSLAKKKKIFVQHLKSFSPQNVPLTHHPVPVALVAHTQNYLVHRVCSL